MGRAKKEDSTKPQVSPASVTHIQSATPDPRVINLLRSIPDFSITTHGLGAFGGVAATHRVSSWEILEHATRHLSNLFQQYSNLIETVPDILYAFTLPDGELTLLNNAFTRVTGLQREDWLGKRFLSLVHPEDVPLAIAQQERMMTGEYVKQVELRFRSQDSRYWIGELTCIPEIKEGCLVGAYGIIQDTTERKNTEEKIVRNMLYDSLTGLPNRVLMLDRLSHSIARYRRSTSTSFAVLLIDLDRFKVINDGLGHQIGDELLIQAAHRLSACVPPEDTVSRMGGDEFVVVLEKTKNTLEVTQIADKIKKALNKPFVVRDREIFTGASMGIALASPRYQHPEEVLRDAETAMYRAKSQGRARYQTFNTGMHAQALSLLERETEIRRAVEQNEFCIHYQPIVDLFSGKPVGLEALLRWNHPERGLTPANEFINLAEEMGLIHGIGQFVLQETCKHMQTWQRQFANQFGMSVSVNFSAQQFSNRELVKQVMAMLQAHQISPSDFVVEITESALMESGPAVESMLLDFHSLNTKLHIDDFGTGYSSLSYLGRFPIDAVKIDRTFVSSMHENVEIIRAIVNLARKLRLRTIAEGVETRQQADQLRSLGCEQAQGFYFSEPVEPANVPEFRSKQFER